MLDFHAWDCWFGFWFEGMVDLCFYIVLVLKFITAHEVRKQPHEPCSVH